MDSGLPAYGCPGVNRRLRPLAELPGGRRSKFGFTIAIGVLIDTFLVRSLLVPALVLEIGDRVWWPSALTHLAGRRRREPAPGPIAVETKS